MKNLSCLFLALIITCCNAWTVPIPIPIPIPLIIPKKISKSISNRGYSKRYGAINNSTIPTPNEVAAIVGVKPARMAPSLVWKVAWRLHGRILPLLHLGDKAKSKDSKYSLTVLWCKAIASLDKRSIVFDNRWTYDTLPSVSRWLLRLIPIWLFPRLHHANIEARTAYLNKIIQIEIEKVPEHCPIRLISIGAGYDIRCSRLMSEDDGIEAYELDLESVVQSKQVIMDRVSRRRPNARHPTLIPIDLNDLDKVKATMDAIISPKNGQTNTHTIFISEGVMIYLQKGVPTSLLKIMAETATNGKNDNPASFCFADRLENVPGGEIGAAKIELSGNGWDLVDWCPKPGLARHMGIARLSTSENSSEGQ